jgi:hypothetical protein
MLCFKMVLARSQVPVVHAYNPSYSGGRNQEDCSSKPGQASGVTQGVGPELKPQYRPPPVPPKKDGSSKAHFFFF